MPRTFRRLGLLALVAVICIALLFVTQNLWLRALGNGLVAGEKPCKADVILVLAGDYTGARALKAAELLKEGWAPKVMISGAGAEYGVNEGDLALDFLRRSGYSTDAFFNDPNPGHSTVEEAQYTVPEMRRRGFHRFLLVTSNFHTRRAGQVYRKAAPDLTFCVVAAPYADFDPDNWWMNREGRKTAFIEWCKRVANVFGI